jgi:hypothetical protein
MEMYYVGNYEEFLCSDNSLQCCHEIDDCEEAVVEQISAKHHKTSEVEESDEDDTTEREGVTQQDARILIAGLRLWFMQEGNEGKPAPKLFSYSQCR